ncbi:MAG: hypothetical protein KDD63_23715 [Bacteroidetes bacterium]|nr:hypothetical protein [Bacteroidota bacterium]
MITIDPYVGIILCTYKTRLFIMQKAILAVFLIAAFLIGCAPEKDSQYETTASNNMEETPEVMAVANRIAPPLENVNVPLRDFMIQPSQDEKVIFENGTELIIPAGSLVDENGEEVKGEVEFSYREFHDVADILMSGIPMVYDSAGVSHNFQTAGMMEIRASQNGKPVFIAEGKEIEVRMASFVEDDGYNLYSLDEETGAWTYEEVSRSQPMPLSEEVKKAMDKVMADLPAEPFKPQTLQPGKTPFDFDVDYSEFPNLSPYQNLVWQIASVQEEGVVKPEDVQAVIGEIWSNAFVVEHERKKGLYYLTLTDDETKKEAKLLVTPVVEKEDYAQAMATYEEIKKKQDALKAKLLAEAKRETQFERQARFQRTFSISSFGIYNCDRIYRAPTQQVFANFEIKDSKDTVDQIFLVIKKDQSVVTYYRYGWSGFRYPKGAECMIVAFTKDSEVVIFDSEDFAAQKPRGKYTFVLEPTGKRVHSPEDLRDVIGV